MITTCPDPGEAIQLRMAQRLHPITFPFRVFFRTEGSQFGNNEARIVNRRIGVICLAFIGLAALVVVPVSAQWPFPFPLPCLGCDCDHDGWNAHFSPIGQQCCFRNCDCNDNNPDIHPGAYEQCDNIDYDCDGLAGEADSDGDGTPNCNDGCELDPLKIVPGVCGCGFPDIDSDRDGMPDCFDQCPADPQKTTDIDTDGDGILDCNDKCPQDPYKSNPGICGCGVSEGCSVPGFVPEFPSVVIPAGVLIALVGVVFLIKKRRFL
jgi:hypothetical protein